jgi:putative CocE/NonD family hydrolase
MRDGVELSADMWMPDDEGQYPAILLRTPYIKTTPRHGFGKYGAYFDHYLKQSTPAFDEVRARIFVTGSNEWKEFTEYPPAKMEAKKLFFHSGGRANSLIGDGRLDWDKPADETPDHFAYDPENPAPSGIGDEEMAIDRRPAQRRDDILVYTSEELSEPLEIIGPVYLALHAATDGLDTDFVGRILDVYPDGRAVKLGPRAAGVIRARYRNSRETTELLTPDKPEEYSIELFDIGHTFLPGHRVQIEVTSSAFPYINPNQNTGNPIATDTEWRTANQTIYHNVDRPSHVLLPVMPTE